MDNKAQLKLALEERKAIIVVGTGVSIMATENAPCVSWKGLLVNGKAYCVDQGWWDAKRQQAFDLLVEDGDLMVPAQMLRQEFDKRGGAHDSKWLQGAFSKLKIKQPAILDALHALSAPLITLNYDPLLEWGAPKSIRFDPITPKDRYHCTEFLKGGERSKVLHLHGYYDSPETVILDPLSYKTLLNDEFTKAFREAMGFTRTIIYVGCGGTFEDPHFEVCRTWMADVTKGAGIVHYRLVLEVDHAEAQKLHRDDGIVPVVFGSKHPQLVDFLCAIAPAVVPVPPPVKGATAGTAEPGLPAKPATFGRDKEIEELVKAILQPAPRPICISAPLGYGKSNLCLAALHHPNVEARFGPRRFFLRLDAVTTCQNLVLAVARVLGLAIDATSDPVNAVMNELGRAPTVLVLDNLETPWEPGTERPQVEQFLGHISNVKGVVLIVSLRGRQLPGPLAWQEPVGALRLLPNPAAMAVFSDIAPEHTTSPLLPGLLAELSGWPLPIVLMAHQSRGASLETVMARWRTEKTRMLERGSASSALDSLHVSIAASITSPRISDSGKRLLRSIAELPDGLLVTDVSEIGFAQHDARNVIELGLLYEEKGRFRVLPAIRSYFLEFETMGGSEQEALNEFFLIKLASLLGSKAGSVGGSGAAARLKHEAGNIEHLLESALATWKK